MTLLVTGGAGFIGSNFILYWLREHPNDNIINLDALTYAGNLNNLRGIENTANYRFVHGDICDAALVNELVAESDTIVHFAAESHVDNSIQSSAEFIRTNVVGTQVLLDAAKNHGNVRFHHVSTDEVFGSLAPGDPKFTETTPYDPRSPYSASKAGSDHVVRAYWHTHGLPVTLSNCSNNYGPRQHKEKLIPLFITKLQAGEKVPVYGNGQNIRDWLHVDDHCRAIDAIIQKGKLGETYCVGGNTEKSNLEVAHMLLALLDKDESWIEYVTDRKGHDFRYAIDTAKIERELGWQPEISFAEGLQKTVDWYRQ